MAQYKTKYTAKAAKFICSKIEQGMTLKEILRKYSDTHKLPSYSSVWRWRSEKEDFRAMIDGAYDSYMMLKHDELEELSSVPTPDHLSKDEKIIYEKDRKARMDALKFILAKMAAMFSARFESKTTIKHEGDVQPTLIVQNYSMSQDEYDGSQNENPTQHKPH